MIPSELSFLSGCSRFSRGGRLSFFLEEFLFFLGGGGEYFLKFAFSHDKVLPCILQDALI